MNVDLKKIELAVEPLLAQEAVELVDLRFMRDGHRWILRFYVDKQGGITLNDCEQLSHRIGGLLDMHPDLVPGSYNLEISSPGLDRVLKKSRDFERFSGHRAKVKLRVAREGQRQFRGYIRGTENDGDIVVLENGEVIFKFPLGDIEEARLDPDIKV